MNKKSITVLAIAGACAGLFALAPSRANAWSGNLIKCSPSGGVESIVTVSPGFDCTETKNKLGVGFALLDGCTPSATAPWDAWAAAKFGSTISSTNAATIKAISISLKALAMGTCNFSATLTDADAGAGGSGKFALYSDAAGTTKVKGGKGAYLAQVTGGMISGNLSGGFSGLVTKGFGLNGEIFITIGIDPTANTGILDCNTGAACPPDPTGAPITALHMKTVAGNEVVIGFPLSTECEDKSIPYHCCEAAGAGCTL